MFAEKLIDSGVYAENVLKKLSGGNNVLLYVIMVNLYRNVVYCIIDVIMNRSAYWKMYKSVIDL